MAAFKELTNYSPILTSEYLSARLSSWFNKRLNYVGSSYQEVDKIKAIHDIDMVKLTIFGKDPLDEMIYKVHVILKTLRLNPNRKKGILSAGLFRNEITFYSKILPQLLQFQADCNVMDPFDNVQRTFAMHSNGLNDFILTEDLSISGYRRLNPDKNMDRTHLEMIIKILAKFHALSFAFKNQRLQSFDNIATDLSEIHFDRKVWKQHLKYWTIITDRAIDTVKKEYPNSIYIKRIEEFFSSKTFFRKASVVRNTQSYGCINHGQVLAANILVKYSEDGKTPLHAVIIDFQLSRYSSPVLDLSTFTFASTEISCKKSYESLLKLYYDYMSRQVRVLGSELPLIYPWHIFNMEVKKLSFVGLAISFQSVPFLTIVEKKLQKANKLPNCFKYEDSWLLLADIDDNLRRKQANNFVFAVEKGFV